MTKPVRLSIDTAARKGTVQTPSRPTLAEIQQWPATCSVRQAACAIGCSPTHLGSLIRRGESPVKTVPLGSSRRQLVITADLVRLLSGEDRGAA